MDETDSGHRLPRNIIPSHYDIQIQPDLESFTFTGQVSIKVHVKQPTRTVTFNYRDMEIEEVTFNTAEGLSITPGSMDYHPQKDRIVLNFDGELLQCDGQLVIKYKGHLRDDLKGFYRSLQTSDSGEKKYAAVTHFEPTGARRAFPCWDEPALKCTFDITLIVPEGKTALSNMNVIETKPMENNAALKMVKFATTPKMSTYIIAFIVGDFDYIEGKADNDVRVRVYTSVGKSEGGRFALEFAKKALVFLENYFQVPYGLPKIDLIGIADFGIGAMENWGLVTYRERYIMVDENTSASTKQFITEIVAHEFTHNWFGNLVTMKWWTDLWLKEGFANFMAALCADNIHPEFDIMTRFLIEEIIRAQKLDALENSHPIEVPVNNPAEINEIFDGISYSKGASINRMLHQYVGDEAFREGLTCYLKKYQFSNTVTEDLWRELEIVSKKPVREVMATWTEKMGFPVVTISRESINKDKQVLKLSQKKFCVGYRDREENTWRVPVNISYLKSNGTEDTINSLMADPEFLIYVDNGTENTKWVKLNYGQRDFYRVKYSEAMMKDLIEGIKDRSLPAVDRLGLQNDLFNLVCGGYSTTVEYISLLKAYVDETDPVVWTDILMNIRKLVKLFELTDVYEQFKAFVISLLSPLSARIGPEPQESDSHSTRTLRNSVYSLLGLIGDLCTMKRCANLFTKLVNNGTVIHPDIRSAVYSTVSSHGNMITFEQLKNLYMGTDVADERVRLLVALGKCRDDEVRSKALEFSISDAVRTQDSVIAISGFFGSNEGRKAAWSFIKQNWGVVIKRSSGGHQVSRLVEVIIGDFASEEEHNDLEDFFNRHPVDEAERAIKQALENVRNNTAWLERLSGVCSIF